MSCPWKPLLAMVLTVAPTTLTLWRDPPLKLIWNASASAPIGLYGVLPVERLERGDLVIVRPGASLTALLAERGYLPRGVPLIKPVAALPGQRVCRQGEAILIDGAVVARARAVDRRGRRLPVWRGCQTITSGELFLLNPRREDSLDGRYFGALPATAVVGRARPLWLVPAPNARGAMTRQPR